MAINMITESETARENQIGKIEEIVREIFSKIKSLYFALEKEKDITTKKERAEFSEIEAVAIRKVIQRHREELKSDGLKSIRGKALKDVMDKLSISKRTPQLTIWTPRATLCWGMLFKRIFSGSNTWSNSKCFRGVTDKPHRIFKS